MDEFIPLETLTPLQTLTPLEKRDNNNKIVKKKTLPTFFGVPIEKYFLQGVTITLGFILIILGLIFITKTYKYIPKE